MNEKDDSCLHELFRFQVVSNPDRVAVHDANGSITYGELHHRSDMLAIRISELGVGPQSLVGICLERTADIPLSILAVMKAGAAYVPINPQWPDERIRFVIADAGLSVLLTHSRLSSRVQIDGASIVYVDLPADGGIASQSPEQLPHDSPDQLAHVIYTSGSTGVPKGVMVTHANVVSLFEQARSWFDFGPHHIWSMLHSFTCDFSVWEMWGALLFGGRLLIVPHGESRSPKSLCRLLSDYRVTVLSQTPAAFYQLITAEASTGLDRDLALDWVLLGGDQLDVRRLSPWFQRHDDRKPQIVNMYGITEATVHSTYRLVTKDCNPPEVGSIIGKPLDSSRIYILNANRQPVRDGEPGELCIAGPSVARGYLNRPALNSQRFVRNPFGLNSEDRLFRSGDLACRLPDGRLQLLGRMDDALQLNGYRIEPAEIEAAIKQHESVKDARVMLRESEAGHRRLVAYVLASESPATLTRSLREHTSRLLPSYMVPSHWIELEQWPLTAHGEIDCRKLPRAPNRELLNGSESFRYLTETEQRLAKIWSRLLGVHPIHRNDDFFLLGGHSLLAAQALQQIQGTFKVELSYREFFEASTLADLASKIAATDQHALSTQPPPVEPAKRTHRMLASYGQAQLWHFVKRYPSLPVYNENFTIRFGHAVDVDAIERSLNEIVKRHEVLRTAILSQNDEPVQVIHERASLRLDLMDARPIPAGQREQAVRDFVSDRAKEPFDIEHPPLMRAILAQVSEDDHRLYLVIHHIVIDAHAVYYVIRDELWMFYHAMVANQPVPLGQLEIQYADYSRWQRKWLDGEFLQRNLAYWKKRIAGAPRLALLTSRAFPPTPTYRGDQQVLCLASELTARIRDLSERHGATLYMTMLSAWLVLLYRHTGQTDIVLGTVGGGRLRPEIEKLVGYFIDTFPIRVDLTGDPTFTELLARVRTTVLEALEYQHVPLVKLIEVLEPSRAPEFHPLFPVMFVMEPSLPDHESGWEVSQLDIKTGTSKFELTLELEERDGEIIGRMEYSTDLFDADVISRMIGQFETLLAGIVSEPATPIGRIPLLGANERRQLLVDWNQTAKKETVDLCLHELFERQVERTPDHIGLVWEGQELSYRQLDDHANALARQLVAHGVDKEQLVGLYIERSAALLVGLLGILKAGCAFVPLDTRSPLERTASIVTDANLELLVTESGTARLAEELGCRSVSVSPRGSDGCASNPRIRTTPDQLAYVLYTSGSTGSPKGVCVEHHSIVNLLDAMRRQLSISSADVSLAISPAIFDIFLAECFLYLTCGARVVLAPGEAAGDPFLTRRLIERCQPTCLQATPTTWAMLLDEGVPLHPIRLAITTGEHIRADLRKRLVGEGCEVWNLYGPTETTVWSTAERLQSHGEPDSIGRPIANTRCYILDEQKQPVPVGVPGELWIGGSGVARGYVNQPQLTADRFVTSPFRHGDRLYRTGDVVRWKPNGSIDFLGRCDDQIKIRGFRIEPGEIEAALNRHPAVRQSLVSIWKDKTGESQLVAWCVPAAALRSTVQFSNSLRQFLQQVLPSYLVPQAFVSVEEWPRTATGKVDRRALPDPDFETGRSCCGDSAPSSDVEQQLAIICADILSLESVGLADNFFELGGHSLRAVQLVSQIKATWGVELPVRLVFEESTVAQLAARIDALRPLKASRRAAEEPPTLETASPQLTLSPAEQRLWFLNQLNEKSAAYNVSYGMRLKGSIDCDRLEKAINVAARRHEALRSTFHQGNDQPRKKIAPAGSLRLLLLIEDLRNISLRIRESECSRRMTHAAAATFDLQKLPLFRTILYRLDEDDQVLLLVFHHIICDDWSVRLLLTQIANEYSSMEERCLPPVFESPSSVDSGTGAAWQAPLLEANELATQLEYWRNHLDGAPPALQLPTDRPRPRTHQMNGRVRHFRVPSHVAGAAKDLARSEDATLFMVTLAAFNVLLASYSRSEKIVVGTPIANRHRPEDQSRVGLLLNTLPLCTDLRGNPSFRDLLRRVRETSLSGFAHQLVPFERMVEQLGAERNTQCAPLFQVMFVLLHEQSPILQLPGVEASPVAIDNGTSKFDLLLTLTETNSHLDGMLEYDVDLFNASTAERVSEHYVTVLEAVTRAPEAKLSDLSLLSEEQQAQLRRWNQTDADYRREACLHELFEEQAVRTPDALAAVCEDRQVSYRQLDSLANRCANRLLKEVVRPNDRVGICLSRGVSQLAAVLAVLKVGATCVPLDPTLPVQRLRSILKAAAPKAILTEGDKTEKLPNSPAIVDFRQAVEQSANHQIQSDQLHSVPERPAYVLFTSGSTGVPKGVAMSHRPLVNLIQWQCRHSVCTNGSRTLHVAPLGFDVAFQELFSTWASGGTLVAPSEAIRRDMFALWRLIERERIERLFAPYVVLVQLAAVASQLQVWPAGLREITTAGETLRITRSIRDLLKHMPQCQLVNQYGPTETHVVTAHTMTGSPDSWPEFPPIGRPISNARIYVLNEFLRPVPIGVPGELYVGGESLASGYLGQPALTAERFVPDPFADSGDGRMYRTGDIARYLDDGSLEFVGRTDNQMKVRGFRVEPGEVESALNGHPLVRESLVTLRGDHSAGPQLVAYWLPVEGERDEASFPTPQELREVLKAALPDYMIPNAFVQLTNWPLSVNGKVDRQALPAPKSFGTDSVGERIAPRNAVEQELVRIWREELGVDHLGIDDDFFELGGHSLLAVSVFSRIRDSFNVHLPLILLFQCRTIRKLAQHLGTTTSVSEFVKVMKLRGSDGERPLTLLPSMSGECLYARKLLETLPKELTVTALQPNYAAENLNFLVDFRATATRYADALCQHQPKGPYSLLGWSYGGMLAYEVARQLASRGKHIAFLGIVDTGPGEPTGHSGLSCFPSKLTSVLANVPGWIREEMNHSSVADIFERCARHFKRLRRTWTHSATPRTTQLEDIFDVGRITPQRRELVRTLFEAFRDYEPQPIQARVTLFRARVRPLLVPGLPDLGWGRWSLPGVEVVQVPGDHQTMLDMPHVRSLAQRVGERLTRQYSPVHDQSTASSQI